MTTLIKDALQNTREDSGASTDYGKGIVIGIISAVMSVGVGFFPAFEVITDNLPEGYRAECIPKEWRDYL